MTPLLACPPPTSPQPAPPTHPAPPPPTPLAAPTRRLDLVQPLPVDAVAVRAGRHLQRAVLGGIQALDLRASA
jgi:hypothetical protein